MTATALLETIRADLSRIDRDGGGVALIRLSVDDLTAIGKTKRHQGRQRALAAIADLLDQQHRAHDTVATVEDGEFLLGMAYRGEGRSVIETAQRLQMLIAGSDHKDLRKHAVTCSVGIGVTSDPMASPDNLLWQADLALEVARSEGPRGLAAYEGHLRDVVIPALLLEQRLGPALEADALDLMFEPVLAISNGAIAGFQAHAGWQPDADGPMIAWPELSAMADRQRIGLDLHWWVFRRACRAAAVWGFDYGPVPAIEVPVAPAQFLDPEFPDLVAQAYIDADLDSDRLSVEVPEQVMAVGERAIKQTLVLDDLGVSVSLCEVGFGASALADLQAAEIASMKVTPPLTNRVADPDSAELIEMVSLIADRIGAFTMVAGVETAEQFEAFEAAGYQLSQGYPFPTLLDADGAQALFRERFRT